MTRSSHSSLTWKPHSPISDLVPVDWKSEMLYFEASSVSYANILFGSLNPHTKKRSPSLLEALQTARLNAGRFLLLTKGLTGAGKSSTTNRLLGHRFEEYETASGEMALRVVDTSKPAALMGSTVDSCTLYPESFVLSASGIKGLDWHLTDCPGFSDTRSIEGRIVASMSIELLASAARAIKGILIVLDETSLGGARGNQFRNLVYILGQVFQKIPKASIDHIIPSCFLIYNPKEFKSRSDAALSAKIGEFLKTFEAEFELLQKRKERGEKDKDFLTKFNEVAISCHGTLLVKRLIDTKRYSTINFSDGEEARLAILRRLHESTPLEKSILSFGSLDDAQQVMHVKLLTMLEESNRLLQKNANFEQGILQITQEIASLKADTLKLQIEQSKIVEREAELGKIKSQLDSLSSISALNERLLALSQSSLRVLHQEIASLRSALAAADSSEEIELYRQSYEVTHAESMGRAGVGLVQAVTGIVWTVGTLGLGYGMAASANRFVNYHKLRYDGGTPYTRVALSPGIDGHVKYDTPAEGRFCYRLNVLGASNGTHWIAVYTEKRKLPSNVREIERCTSELGSATSSGKLYKQQTLVAEIARYTATIAEKKRAIDEQRAKHTIESASIVEAKRRVDESLKTTRAKIIELEEKKSALIRFQSEHLKIYRDNLPFYVAAYQLCSGLNYERHERVEIREIMAQFLRGANEQKVDLKSSLGLFDAGLFAAPKAVPTAAHSTSTASAAFIRGGAGGPP